LIFGQTRRCSETTAWLCFLFESLVSTQRNDTLNIWGKQAL